MSAKYTPPELSEFIAAQPQVAKVAQRTPLVTSRFLADLLRVPELYLKCENLQRTGSYKLRGAYNHIANLAKSSGVTHVVAASAGNHAQGVAYAARELGLQATIFMPRGVALPKLQATRNYGADIVLGGINVDETLAAANVFAAKESAHFVPPFDDHDVIIGQGTVGLEMFTAAPELETIIVPVGGGGLISGIAVVAKRLTARQGRHVRVIGVQAENVASFENSLAAGEPIAVNSSNSTIADGIAVFKPGHRNLAVVRDYVDEIVTVSDEDIARAIVILFERAKLVVEPAGAAAVAAIVAGKVHATGVTAVVLSGGNIDPLLMQRVIGHGLAAASRYLKLRILLPDHPGQLVRTAEIVARQNANVVEVLHTRHTTELPVSDVELELHIETRGEEHGREVVDALESAGYVVRVRERY
ncbi:threonine ammonia-lyase [Canibacter sp. lx-45]|uniref:threonine ammonia-lyase n=1 Tax=Canibacter zhuwentaonis TaxID=2837491 RepID=UPI001BDBD330|nr:threonine ammonia-lyase [Canibacter zhuwentaonis]